MAMNGAGVDKLVNDNIEIYDKYEGESVNGLYTNESTDTAYLYCLAGKKILAVHNEKSTEYATGKIAVNALTVSAGRIYLSDSKSVYTIQQTKQQATLLYRDTLETAFGNIFIDPYHNLVLCGSAHLTVLTGGLPVCRYPINYYIDQIGFDNKNRLWAASRGGDLFVLKIDPGKRGKYLELLKKYGSPYPGLSARSLTVDHFNNLWIGTRHEGLYRFEFTDDLSIRSFQHYTIKEGMSDNFITHLTCDNENNIWASTPSGVDKISYVNNKRMRIENTTRSNYIYEQTLKTFVTKKGVAWSYTSDGNL